MLTYIDLHPYTLFLCGMILGVIVGAGCVIYEELKP